MAALLPALPAHAEGTRAGTVITNTAKATYTPPNGTSTEIESDPVALTVDEVLDVDVNWADTGNVIVSEGATGQVLRFTVQNIGNGTESFQLTPTVLAGDFNPSDVKIYLDTNANGVYDDGVDTEYVAQHPSIDPDQTISVFIRATIPGTLSDADLGNVRLTAAAVTGTGTAGDIVAAGGGDGGGDAVVGASGGDDEDTGTYEVDKVTTPPDPDNASVTLVKSAAVLDAWGGATVTPDAVITYSIVADPSGTGSVSNLVISDVIPDNTTFEAGTITLNSTALTDAADQDAASYDSTTKTVSVNIGTLAGSAADQTVTFKVKVNNPATTPAQ